MTDAEFDRLAEIHNYERVGYSAQHGIPHMFPMFSLKKMYVGEKPIILDGDIIKTPKLDGAAISLLYVEGKLVLALTRGDGKRGEDITEKLKLLVPNDIGTMDLPVQITGEIVAKKTISNARNYAAGALNLKSIDEFKNRDLTFIAYGIQLHENEVGYGYYFYEDMCLLNSLGFKTVIDNDWLEYPQDGQVFRLNDNEQFKKAGFTSSAPRGAYALKTRAEGVITILRGVDWQVGRTGVVSPVAILDPVLVGEATVSRATLHNIKYIRELDLDIGCKVELIRSGEIIPRVVRRVND